jgi:hypothetical protein
MIGYTALTATARMRCHCCAGNSFVGAHSRYRDSARVDVQAAVADEVDVASCATAVRA